MSKLIDSISHGVPSALAEIITLGRTLKKREDHDAQPGAPRRDGQVVHVPTQLFHRHRVVILSMSGARNGVPSAACDGWTGYQPIRSSAATHSVSTCAGSALTLHCTQQ